MTAMSNTHAIILCLIALGTDTDKRSSFAFALEIVSIWIWTRFWVLEKSEN